MNEQSTNCHAHEFPQAAKVIDFRTYKKCANLSREHHICYITSPGAPSPLKSGSLSKLSRVIDSLPGFIALKSLQTELLPDLVLIDAKLDWADPLAVIHFLCTCLEAPIVMLCAHPQTATSGDFVKRAYLAGIQDALYAPLQEEDILETIDVLLRLKSDALC